MDENAATLKTRALRIILVFSALLMALKFFAYAITHSNAILTDALESIINVVAGIFAVISLAVALRPKDENHPYGHGKIEFVSAAFEGSLIFLAGAAIITKSIYGFFQPPDLKSLDTGTWLAAIAGACNYVMGSILVRIGKKHKSLLMVADGKHLISDTVSSIGLIAGLIVIQLTQRMWLDNVLAIIFGAVIFYTGYKLLRESMMGLLDEADYEKLGVIISTLNKNREPKWIDMHNLRAIKHGAQLHVDAHVTLPWYETLEESHRQVKNIEQLLKSSVDDDTEIFIHSDPCRPASCPICTIQDCKVRKAPFVKKLDWTMENVLPNRPHAI